MKRNVLIISIEEIKKHFAANFRQDIKIVVPEVLTNVLFHSLKTSGKEVKAEKPLSGNIWKHSEANEPNYVCESDDFSVLSPQWGKAPYAISFANEKAQQDEHYHEHHIEIYFSEHLISADFRFIDEIQPESVSLQNGGVFVFSPYVIHKMYFSGLTVILETPSFAKDKIRAKL